MYAQEIHSAIDSGDFNRVWELMFQRTSWIQNNTFPPEEVSKLIEETNEIKERLVTVQRETNDKMVFTTKKQHVARAYGSWGRQK